MRKRGGPPPHAKERPVPGAHVNPLQPRIDYAGLPRDDEESTWQPPGGLAPELVMPATSIQTPPAAPPPVEEPIKARKSKAKVVEEPEEEVAPAKRGRGRPKKVAPVKRGRKAAVVEAEDEADAPEDDTEAIDATEKSTAAPANTQFSSPYAAEPVRKPGSPPSYSLISQQQHQQPLTLVLPTPIPALHEIAPALLKSGVLSIQKVEKMTLAELFEECKSEGILDLYSNQKDAVAGAVKRARLRKHGFMLSAGCIEVLPDGFGFLRPAHNDYLPSTDDVFVSQAIIKRHGLKTGHMVEGAVRPPKDNEKYLALSRVDTVNEEDPSVSLTKTPFEELTPIYPNSRLVLETNAETIETRIIDLISPIGKGQRGLIVSPPRAGKTVLLQKIANAISKNNPECHLLVLLVDERPEEVTDMERSINGEVIASTFDEPASRHVQVCHMVIQKAKRMVEFGKDVVILLDSITRMARAHNIETPSSSKILSGGIDAGALQKPKQFFGSARNIEEGGSLTVLGTALIDTGSRMDEVIFEEFKGTGNMELVLDRRLADRRIFPALDINMSGTRREDLLMAPDELQRSWVLRRFMNDISDPVEAMDLLLEKIKKTKTNAEFLLSLDVGR